MDLAERLGDTDALVALDDAYAAAWRATDDSILSLCRDRVGMLLRHPATLEAMSDRDRAALRSWSSAGTFSEAERAALDFTEQYIIDVTELTDAQSERLRAHLGDVGMVDFVNALLVIEQRMTLELALDGVLGADA